MARAMDHATDEDEAEGKEEEDRGRRPAEIGEGAPYQSLEV